MINELVVEGFTPTEKQKEIINACTDDTTKYIVGCFGRQAGKSFTAQNLILKWVLEDNGSVAMWVSPVYSQAKKVFTELTNTIAETGLTKSVNKSELTITFINGSVLYFRSKTRGCVGLVPLPAIALQFEKYKQQGATESACDSDSFQGKARRMSRRDKPPPKAKR